jgi:hypothetical protein
LQKGCIKLSVRVETIMARARHLRSELLAEVAAATPAELSFRPGDRWSVRDILIHLGNWENEGVKYLTHMLRNEPLPTDDVGEINEWNRVHLGAFAGMDAAGALEYLARVRADLEAAAAQVTADDLDRDQSFLGVLLMSPDHEAGHLEQVREVLARARGDEVTAAIHYLRYARVRLLARLNLEYRAIPSLFWRPGPEAWSTKDMLAHLAIWDRHWAGFVCALADGRELPPLPYPEGGLDAWNREQVEARRYAELAEVLHELGAARGALEEQIRRLSPHQVSDEQARNWFRAHREHDNHHMHQMMERIRGWRGEIE